MKFTKTLLLSLAVLSASAIPQDFPKMEIPGMSSSCLSELEKTSKCMKEIDNMTGAESCEKALKSSNCSSLLKDLNSKSSSCEGAYKFASVSTRVGYSLTCSKDSNGYCPVSKLLQKNKDASESELLKALEETCNNSSPECVEKTKVMFGNLEELVDTIKDVDANSQIRGNSVGVSKEAIKIMSDSKCTGNASPAKADNKTNPANNASANNSTNPGNNSTNPTNPADPAAATEESGAVSTLSKISFAAVVGSVLAMIM